MKQLRSIFHSVVLVLGLVAPIPVLFGQPATPVLSVTRNSSFLQVTPTTMSDQGATLTMYGSVRPPLLSATAFLFFGTTIRAVSLTSETRVIYERTFGNPSELDREHPPGSFVYLDIPLFGQILETRAVIPYRLLLDPPVQNFASLQNWSGGTFDVVLRPGVQASQVRLTIWRADDARLSNRTSLGTVSFPTGNTATLTGINATPGETLYGELEFLQLAGRSPGRPSPRSS